MSARLYSSIWNNIMSVRNKKNHSYEKSTHIKDKAENLAESIKNRTQIVKQFCRKSQLLNTPQRRASLMYSPHLHPRFSGIDGITFAKSFCTFSTLLAIVLTTSSAVTLQPSFQQS